jgi:hypothetical protein
MMNLEAIWFNRNKRHFPFGTLSLENYFDIVILFSWPRDILLFWLDQQLHPFDTIKLLFGGLEFAYL